MSTNDINNDTEKLEELKQYATDLGITFRENIGIAKLELKIQEKEDEIAAEKRKSKAKTLEAKNNKVKVVIEPRERDHGVNDQFFGFNSLATGLKERIRIHYRRRNFKGIFCTFNWFKRKYSYSIRRRSRDF